MSAGKSSVAKELAKLTAIRNVPMDRIRWYYYFDEGFSLEKELALPSFTEVMTYWKPYEVSAVKRIIAEFGDSIIDFGAGHSYFPNPDQFAQVAEVLAPHPNVFLLLPSPDPVVSLRICNERLALRKKAELESDEINANRAFIEHESNAKLAKRTVYTDGKTPSEVAREIVGVLSDG